MKKLWWLAILLIIVIIYFLGPHPKTPVYATALPAVPTDPKSLDNYIAAKEKQHKLRKDNEARIIWADSSHSPTEYVFVYLHGFSASQGEGDPVHKNLAKKFHSNLLLTRLSEHGIDTSEMLLNMTAEGLWNSSKEALAIAHQIGKKVILIGTSTGGTLALMLAAQYPDIRGVVLLSPNIAIFDKAARITNDPWGSQIARLVTGSKYIFSTDTSQLYKQYWSFGYRVEAVGELEELLETSMTRTNFAKVKQPLLLLYYYKDNVHQDSVVSVPAMKDMFNELGTPTELKRAVAIPNAGNHVIGSYIKSKDVKSVEAEIGRFLEVVMKMS